MLRDIEVVLSLAMHSMFHMLKLKVWESDPRAGMVVGV